MSLAPSPGMICMMMMMMSRICALSTEMNMDEIWSIWDLDGCLSDDTARIPLTMYGWQAYHAACGSDPVRAAEAELMVAWRLRSPHHRVAIFTGRPKSALVRTVEWLKRHDLFPYIDMMRFRREGDTRSSVDVKREMYERLMDGYRLFDGHPSIVRQVSFAVDDRSDIITLWTELGIPSLKSTVKEEVGGKR